MSLSRSTALRKCEDCSVLFRRPLGFHQMENDRVNPTPFVRADDDVWKCPKCRDISRERRRDEE
jgi:hypothetical protein